MKTILLVSVLWGGLDAEVQRLGSDSFLAREKATQQLSDKMSDTLYFQFLGLDIQDVETRLRIKTLLQKQEGKMMQRCLAKLVIYQNAKGESNFPWFDGFRRPLEMDEFSHYQFRRTFVAQAEYLFAYEGKTDGYSFYDYPVYRLATRFWVEHSFNTLFSEALKSKTEKQFNETMCAGIEAINQEVLFMTGKDDQWWRGNHKTNPYKVVK